MITKILVSLRTVGASKVRHQFIWHSCICLLICCIYSQIQANDFIAPVIQIADEVLPGEQGTESNLLKVNIKDAQPLISANLLFRERGSTRDYSYVELIKDEHLQEKNRFTYTGIIKKSNITSKEVEVYVEVLDARGNRSQYPPAENPLELRVLHHSVRRGFPSKTSHWVGIGLGAVALIAAIASASSSGNSSGSSSPSLTITAPLPE